MTTQPPNPPKLAKPPQKPLDDAGQRLVMENMGLARQSGKRACELMSRRGNAPVDREEAQASALFGLVTAAARYDPERGIQFTTFALPYCFGYAFAAIAPPPEPCASEAQLEALEAGGDSADTVAFEVRDAFDHLCALACRLREDDALSHQRWESLILLSQGYSYEEIARLRSVAPKVIRQRAYQAAAVIRRFANPDNYV